MGRLTLNVLLSFAQFEREVTGDRIRDKIAASKQKGLWMGGTASIGYVGHERTLVIDEVHAALIRYLYKRYLVLGSIRAFKIDLDDKHIYAPLRYRVSGNVYGGKPFSRGNLQRILSNPVYLGKMTHFDKVFEGQHPAIIDQALWDAVQAKITGNKQSHEQRPMVASDSLLTGILYDDEGNRLTPSHRQKQSKRFRYYLSQKLVNEGKATTPNGLRFPAQKLEAMVINQLCDWLTDTDAIINAINPEPGQIQHLIAESQKLATDLQDNKNEQYVLLRQILERVEVGNGYISLFVKVTALAILGDELTDKLITLKTNIQLKRCGYAMRLIITDNDKKQTLKDQNLIDHLSQAYQWLTLITSGKVQSIKEIAEAEDLDQSHVTRMINKAFLVPEIMRAILNGNQPAHLTLKHLKQFRALPNNWRAQKTLLGFI
jgi:site-specific DNA recombinase